MSEAFEYPTPAADSLFYSSDDRTDPRLGEIVRKTRYDDAQIVIVGFASDEGVRRAGRREGAASGPDAVRSHLYKCTPFGVNRRVHDLGDIGRGDALEAAHDRLTEVARKVISDGKKLVVIGGGGDATFADGRAMAAEYGAKNWLAVNVDGSLGMRQEGAVSSDSAIRFLLEGNLVSAECLHEVGYQAHLVSPHHFRELQQRGVRSVSIDQLRSHESTDVELRELMRQRFIHHSSSLTALFSFDLHAVRASEAPGTSDSNPIGLRSGEFLNLVHFAAKLVNTKIVEFVETNPALDVDGRTAKLVAVAIHRFLSSQPHI